MSSAEEIACSDIDTATLLGSALDVAILQAITSVTVYVVTDCSGLTVTMDPAAVAQFETSEIIIDALAASGQAGAEVVGYSLDGASLTVYVRSRNQ